MENDNYGLMSQTKTEHGYLKEVSNYTNDIRYRQEGFISLRERSHIREIDAKSFFTKNSRNTYTLCDLINQLKDEGYESIERYILTELTLPFSVVRIIIPGLNCPNGL